MYINCNVCLYRIIIGEREQAPLCSQLPIFVIIMHQNGVSISAQGWIGIPKHQNGSPDWRAYIHFSLVRVADFEQRFAREFRRAQKSETSYIYFSTESLGCAECECFAGTISIVCGNQASMGWSMYSAWSAEH